MPSLNEFTNLRFPESLGTADNPTWITFRPTAVKYGAVETTNPGSPEGNLGAPGFRASSTGGLVEDVTSTAKEKYQEAVQSVNRLSTPTGFKSAFSSFTKNIKGQIRVGDFTLSNGASASRDLLEGKGSINLILPENLSTNSGVNYNQEEIGPIGAAAVNATIGAGSAQDDVSNKLSDIGKAIVTRIGNAGPIKSVRTVAVGKIANPYSFSVFQGVNHRSFDYTWTLIARNSRESKVIKDITDMFVYYMLPGRGQDKDLEFIDIPVQWDITYYGLNGSLEFHQQPNACFLQDVNVEYGADAGNQLHSDGSPVVTKLSLKFTEIEPMYREKIPETFSQNRLKGNFEKQTRTLDDASREARKKSR